MCLFASFTLLFIRVLVFLIVLRFLYIFWTQVLFFYKICKCFLPGWGLSFNSGNIVFEDYLVTGHFGESQDPCFNLKPLWKDIFGPELPAGWAGALLQLHCASASPSAQSATRHLHISLSRGCSPITPYMQDSTESISGHQAENKTQHCFCLLWILTL